MRQKALLSLSFVVILTQCTMTEQNPGGEPLAQSVPFEMTTHGDTRVDEYYWMRDRENPEVIEYLNAENAYREKIMKATEPLQERLYEEIVGRIKKDDSSVPYELDGYFYYTRFNADSEYPIYCRKEGSLEAEEEVLLDVNELAQGHDYYQVTGLSMHPSNQKISFGVDTVSRRIYTLYTKDLITGAVDLISEAECTGGSTWSADGNFLFYTVKDLETFAVVGSNAGMHRQEITARFTKRATRHSVLSSTRVKARNIFSLVVVQPWPMNTDSFQRMSPRQPLN